MVPTSDQPTNPRIFTLAEANATLPKINPLLQQLQQLYRSIMKANEELDELTGKLAQGNGYPIQALKERIQSLTTHQFQLVEAFESALAQLEELGAILKDLTMGLVDFYGLRDNQMICLCWKIGEDRVRFWHTLEEGYPGRQPLD